MIKLKIMPRTTLPYAANPRFTPPRLCWTLHNLYSTTHHLYLTSHYITGQSHHYSKPSLSKTSPYSTTRFQDHTLLFTTTTPLRTTPLSQYCTNLNAAFPSRHSTLQKPNFTQPKPFVTLLDHSSP